MMPIIKPKANKKFLFVSFIRIGIIISENMLVNVPHVNKILASSYEISNASCKWVVHNGYK